MAFARNGNSALANVRVYNFDLILLDVMMPEMNGFEVCLELKKNSLTRDIPIIFLTARTDTESIAKAFGSGGVDYVTKPFNKTELMARIRTHLELKCSREDLEIAYRKLEKINEALLDSQKKLELAAKTDYLTELSNRRDIIEKIENEKIRTERSGKPFSLILCDIDNFKDFNDQYGHDCGDFVLVTVAETMRSRIRKQDSVARWGGEEFLLLLPETDMNGGGILAEAIRKTISDTVCEYDEHRFGITMTFGVSLFSHPMNIDQCVKMADDALYRGKRLGKNRVVLYRRLSAEQSELTGIPRHPRPQRGNCR